MAVRVKICGITHPDDAALAVEEGADALGFVVEYPDANPWILSRRRAVELMRAVPPFVTRVAVAPQPLKSSVRTTIQTRIGHVLRVRLWE